MQSDKPRLLSMQLSTPFRRRIRSNRRAKGVDVLIERIRRQFAARRRSDWKDGQFRTNGSEGIRHHLPLRAAERAPSTVTIQHCEPEPDEPSKQHPNNPRLQPRRKFGDDGRDRRDGRRTGDDRRKIYQHEFTRAKVSGKKTSSLLRARYAASLFLAEHLITES